MWLVGGRGGALAGIRSMHTGKDGIPQPPVSSCQRTPRPRWSPCPRRSIPWHDSTGRGRSRRQVHRCTPRSHSRSGRNKALDDRKFRCRGHAGSPATAGETAPPFRRQPRAARCPGHRRHSPARVASACDPVPACTPASSSVRGPVSYSHVKLRCGDPEGLALPYRQGGPEICPWRAGNLQGTQTQSGETPGDTARRTRGSDGAPGSAPSRVARPLPDDPPAPRSRSRPAGNRPLAQPHFPRAGTLAPLARY